MSAIPLQLRVLALLFAMGGGLASASSLRQARGAVDPDQKTEKGDAIRARNEWFMRGRRAPGQNAATLRARAFQQRQELVRSLAIRRGIAPQATGPVGFSSGIGPAWQAIGPRPLISDPTGGQSYGDVSGRVTAIAVDQADPSGNTVYAAGAYGGVWKTTNATVSPASNVVWTALTDDQATQAVNAIAVSPNGQTVLAGSGEPNNAIDSYYGLGILRSTSAGAPGTWTLISGATGGQSFHGLGVSKIAFNTNNPLQVVAGISHTVASEGSDPGNQIGLYFSANGGASWTLASMLDGSTPGSVSDVVFDRRTNLFYAAVRFHGFYVSSNGGQSWSRLAQQPNPTALTLANCPAVTSFNCALFRGQLAVNPNTHELFAWFVDSKSIDEGIWVTPSNQSAVWTRIADSSITNCGDKGGGCGTGQGFYDLYLSAIPNGSGTTDLYAGAVNLYKSVNHGAFANLTHVYGCNPIHMHPDYHAQDFLQSNPNIIYFGNDGGIYRSLSGGTRLTGSCIAPNPNPISSLNDGIGSLTQFISFSQHPTNPGVIIGGTQDNGSPGTSSAGAGTAWATVNLGDGGYNEIDPVNPLNLYTSNTDVTIQHCNATSGDPICEFLPFDPVVNIDRNVGPVNFPDHGDFYTPYILDPGNSGRVIIGTCRVWRGSATNAANWSAVTFANALSNKLNAGAAAGSACTSGETYYVSALAAGGPVGAGGSQVIYAGMSAGVDGAGNAVGGTIWVTTNAAGGAGTWVNRTGAINSNHFNISSVAVDSADASGNTAYITVMGFTAGAGHIFKTVNAGASWTDITGNLPNAPADSIVVDPLDSNDLFVGTDIGIFRSTSGGNSWAPFGDFFPNVVVNHLRIFNSGGVLKLRASTHGRGIWEANFPDYSLSISNLLVIAFPNQTGVFQGTLIAADGYNSAVSLSCQGAGMPTAGCAANPSSATPTASFQVNASATATQDFNFTIAAAGSDPTSRAHQQAVTLRVIDFTLGAPGPSSLTVFPNTTSASASFNVSSLGQFNQPVSLSCGGLPAYASCNFSSNPAVPAPGAPVNVTVTISASTLVAAGNYAVSIIGDTNGAPAPKSVTLNITIPDFTVTATPLVQTMFPTSANRTFDGTLTSLFGYANNVTLTCAAGQTAPPSTCNVAPANPFTPTANGTAFTVTAGDSNIQDFVFNIQGIGSDPGANVRVQPVRLRVVDFALGPLSTASVTMPRSSISQPVNFQLRPLGSFNAKVTFTCGIVPAAAGVSCAFNGIAAPAAIAVSGSPLPVSLTITASGSVAPGSYSVVVTASTPGRPNGSESEPAMSLTVTAVSASTDIAIADGAPEAATVAHAVGAPITLTFLVSNTGTAVTQANAYINFSEPVFVQSVNASIGLCSGGASTTASLSCAIGAMATPDNATVTMVVVPGLVRDVNASAVVNSEDEDTNVSNNTVTLTPRQVRVRPLARQNLPAKLP